MIEKRTKPTSGREPVASETNPGRVVGRVTRRGLRVPRVKPGSKTLHLITGMKKRELATLVREAIREGVMDNMTTQLSRLIVNHMKASRDWSNIQPFVADIGDLKVKAVFQPSQDGLFRLRGAAYDQLGQVVKLGIEVPTEANPSGLSDFIPSLKNTLRHELEHRQQDKRSGFELGKAQPHAVAKGSMPGEYPKDVGSTIESSMAYYLHPKEVEAYVMGAYKEAKTRKVPFGQVLQNQLMSIYDQLSMKFDEVGAAKVARAVQRAWMEYIKVRFPHPKS